ncbi:MAG TPA: ABC transporter permease [Chloroflexota bacterium]|nr:ABC transporter permease [Chloroflexota bacterium]
MSSGYVARRLFMFVVVVWGAATLNFFLARVPSGQTSTWQQYGSYIWNVVRFDFGPSRIAYPTLVMTHIEYALPWTIGLLLVTTAIAFSIGTVLGALMAWSRAPSFARYLAYPLFMFAAMPYYLLGMILLYVLAYQARLFPLFGAYPIGTFPDLSPTFVLTVLHHAALPAISIVIATTGIWALSMRGMMVTVQGEDFLLMAEAKGLKERRIFLRYALRNALLPQVTSLGLTLGTIMAGSVLVELVFAYPGIGLLLQRAIRQYDYALISGIVYLIILAIALATLILDLIYPLLDPRIRYDRA